MRHGWRRRGAIGDWDGVPRGGRPGCAVRDGVVWH